MEFAYNRSRVPRKKMCTGIRKCESVILFYEKVSQTVHVEISLRESGNNEDGLEHSLGLVLVTRTRGRHHHSSCCHYHYRYPEHSGAQYTV